MLKGASKSLTEKNMTSAECNVCTHKIVNSRQLPCKHVFCLDCIRGLVHSTGRSDNLPCPNCRGLFAITTVPKDSLDPPHYIREKYKHEIKPVEDAVIKHKEKIMGMAILQDELFVVCKSPPNVIFKYNIGASTRVPGNPDQLNISEMKWPRGIAASQSLSCLYITDWNKMFGGRLWRYKYQKGQEADQENPVAILDIQPFGVSVSEKTDAVLVTCATPANVFARRGWISIYQPCGVDFIKVRTIALPGLEIPRHSLLTLSSKFVVCHGWSNTSHGVTSYLHDEKGQIRKISFYGKVSGSGSGEQEMNKPLSMTQDEDGLILVVDYCNNRIQLLTEDLHLVRHLITNGIIYPRHVCQHPKTGRMYVGQEDGKVQILDARIVAE